VKWPGLGFEAYLILSIYCVVKQSGFQLHIRSEILCTEKHFSFLLIIHLKFLHKVGLLTSYEFN